MFHWCPPSFEILISLSLILFSCLHAFVSVHAGVNLTRADTVIIYDSDWNYTVDSQAQDRCQYAFACIHACLLSTSVSVHIHMHACMDVCKHVHMPRYGYGCMHGWLVGWCFSSSSGCDAFLLPHPLLTHTAPLSFLPSPISHALLILSYLHFPCVAFRFLFCSCALSTFLFVLQSYWSKLVPVVGCLLSSCHTAFHSIPLKND